jgi:ketosteroid isomerase-like protein
MSYTVPRSLVEEFYRAYAAREAAKVAEFLDDDVEWCISGPVDVLPFCGQRHGKAAVLEIIERLVPHVFRIYRFVIDTVLIDGDRVATLNRLSALRSEDDRVISYRLAHFLRFRDGKIVENLSLIDSFDAVEQVLGIPLTGHGCAMTGDLVAI